MSLIDKIRDAEDIARVLCEVPEWGVEFYLYSMSGAERERYEEHLYRARSADGKISMSGLRARVIIACARDEDGKRLFDDQHASMLQNKSGAVLDRIANQALKVSGLVDDSELKEMEEN